MPLESRLTKDDLELLIFPASISLVQMSGTTPVAADGTLDLVLVSKPLSTELHLSPGQCLRELPGSDNKLFL